MDRHLVKTYVPLPRGDSEMQNLRKTLGLDRKPQAPAKPQAQAAKKGKKPDKPEPAPGATITYQCGHRLALRQAEQCACDDCRIKNKTARRGRYKAKRREQQEQSRLPDNSAFAVIYDAANTTWHGSLTVNGVTFEGECSGVFRLLSALDKMYRDSVARPEEACK
jgi:hypothetical protein